MANVVEQINNAITSRVTNVLGSTYSQLDYILDVSKNQFFGNKRRFGVRPLSGASVIGVTRQYTIDQEFEIIITHDFVNVTNDSDQRAKQFILYDQMDSIFVDLFLTKANIPNIILNIEAITLGEPEFNLDESLAVLRSQIVVKYRQALS